MNALKRLLPILLAAGCRNTRADLTPAATPAPETVAPWSCPILVYDTGHPISWPYATDYAAIEDAYLSAINDERMRNGIPALKIDSLAVEGARAHAFHMNLHSFLSTVNPEGDGPGDRYLRMGAMYRTVREAVLMMDTVDVSLFGGQLYATDVNHVGIGVWRAPEAGLYFVVVDFTWR